MRDERKLNEALRRDGMDTQSDILEELKRIYPQYAAERKSDGAVKRKRIAVISSLAAVAACAAIIIPCAILLPNRDAGNGQLYCTYSDSDYSTVICDYTLRDYSDAKGGKILYFDWYDTAEEYTTYSYKCKADGKIFGVEEYMYLGDTEETVYVFVTEINVYLTTSNYNIEKYTNEYNVSNHNIKWKSNGGVAACMFEEGGYRYFIRTEDGQDETRLFELASELLQKN